MPTKQDKTKQNKNQTVTVERKSLMLSFTVHQCVTDFEIENPFFLGKFLFSQMTKTMSLARMSSSNQSTRLSTPVKWHSTQNKAP